MFYLELFLGNLKSSQAVKEAADDVVVLVNPNMIHYSMVNFKKAADLSAKQKISTFALITKDGKTDKLGELTNSPQTPSILIACITGVSGPI
jgi:hypothetical protein